MSFQCFTWLTEMDWLSCSLQSHWRHVLLKFLKVYPGWIGSHVHCRHVAYPDGLASVLMQWTWEPIHLGKPRETLIGHDVSVTAMNMRSNPSWVNHVKFIKVSQGLPRMDWLSCSLQEHWSHVLLEFHEVYPRWIGSHVHCSNTDVMSY
jgi:hypothetical protein